MNHKTISNILAGTLSFGIFPKLDWLIGRDSLASLGRLLWLHLLMIVPSFSNKSPGLLRMIVFKTASSVMQNGYSAPVRSIHRLIAFVVLAVRQ